MSEALHDHLDDQRAASMREWRAATEHFVASLTWTRNACFIAFVYSLTFWLLPSGSWERGVHSMVGLAAIVATVYRTAMHIRQWRRVKRLDGIASALQHRHFKLHCQELVEMMKKRMDEGEEWKQ